MPIKSRNWNYEKLCRKCGKASDTQLHRSTMCKKNFDIVRTHHDSIVTAKLSF